MCHMCRVYWSYICRLVFVSHASAGTIHLESCAGNLGAWFRRSLSQGMSCKEWQMPGNFTPESLGLNTSSCNGPVRGRVVITFSVCRVILTSTMYTEKTRRFETLHTLRPDTVTHTERQCTLSGTRSKWRLRRKLVFAALAA